MANSDKGAASAAPQTADEQRAQYAEWLRAQGLEDLASRITQPDAQGWRPEPGAVLIGSVVEKSTAGQGGQYGPYPLLTIKTFDGEVAVHAFHAVLRNAVEHVQVGDSVAIEYVGRGRNKADTMDMEMYRVKVGRRETPIAVPDSPESEETEIPF